jgi:peptide/nickel transport system substrate-binding protein
VPLRSRAARSLALSVAATLAMTACSANSSDSASGADTLTVGSTVAPQSWDPAYVGDANYVPYAQAAYDSLIRRTGKNTYVPMLATKWDITDKGRTVELELRRGVTFSDGTRFDAAAVKANVEYFAKAAGPLGNELAGLSEAEVLGDYRIRLRFKAAIPDIEYNLSDAAGRMASPKALGTPGLRTRPVGTGPYVMDVSHTVQGSTYTLTARKGYWAPSLQKFDKVVFKAFPNEIGLLNAVKSGQVDAGNLSSPDNVANAESSGIRILHPKYHISWAGLIFMDRSGKQVPALKNPDVRRAIAHAVDSRGILKAAADGRGEPNAQIFNKSSTAYNPQLTDAYAYDPALAKRLMAKAGQTKGFTLTMPATPGFLSPAVQMALQKELAVINIKVDWVNVPVGSLYSDLAKGKFPVSYVVFGSVPTDWSVVQNYLSPQSPWNPDRTTDPRLEQLVGSIPGASRSQQDAAFTQINEFVVDNAWFDPWFWVEENFAVNDTVKVQLQPLQNVPFIYNYAPAD